MMETNTTANGMENSNIPIIHPYMILIIPEADFSAWEFYEESIYASAFNFKPAVIVHAGTAIKKRAEGKKRKSRIRA